jgi:hypothetical protein
LASVVPRNYDTSLIVVLLRLFALIVGLSLSYNQFLKSLSVYSTQEGLEVPSTPKKLLGSLLEGKSEAARLEEELMTSR